ncbi:MAG: 6-phosphofructokinase [Crocinitomicaceae bacterium]|nr:6-phosphofructokinase [Crocinitomicaceae bacterium]
MCKSISNIGVLTSGGDSPGMNAAVRAVVRTAIYNGKKAFGIYDGYQGMIEGRIKELEYYDVSNIIQKGGTILGTARCMEFKTKEGRKKAYENLIQHNIDGLIVIGGDGSFTGAHIFSQEYDLPIIGLPGTIDNDLFGTQFTIGFDSAVNTVVQAIDKIRDTAGSHHRLFFVEVMGRDAGFIALHSGIGVGAEDILIPEEPTDIQKLVNRIQKDEHTRKSQIVVVAEGDDFGGAQEVANEVKKQLPNFDIKVTVLGHVQRGGSPSSFDRVLASRLGVQAVQSLLEGKSSVMIGFENRQTVEIEIEKAIKHHTKPNLQLLELVKILSSGG